jgi:putative two-component system response regulator
MKQHALKGYEILAGSGSELLELAAVMAWTHHERFDGSGYPRGLRGEAIPLEGRIVAIGDVFDALTSRRVYKPAFSIERSLELLRRGRAAQFDPELLDLFLGSLDEVRMIHERFGDPPGPAA